MCQDFFLGVDIPDYGVETRLRTPFLKRPGFHPHPRRESVTYPVYRGVTSVTF